MKEVNKSNILYAKLMLNEVNILTLTIFVLRNPNCLKTFDKSFLRLLGMRNNLHVTLCMNRYGLLKMLIGPLYWIRMVYLKNGKWSAVCLIEYVWSNFFQLTVPAYVLMSMYRLFGTEE